MNEHEVEMYKFGVENSGLEIKKINQTGAISQKQKQRGFYPK
jgi:hypothetical protein